MRYWDGWRWTEHRAVVPPGPHGHPSTPPQATKPSGANTAFGWMGRHKLLAALGVLLLIGMMGSAVGADDAGEQLATQEGSTEVAHDSDASAADADADETSEQASPTRSNQHRDRRVGANERDGRQQRSQGQPGGNEGSSNAGPGPSPRTYLVTRVIDGDTLELGNGETVRLVGIDTPEVGECGYDKATVALANLVQGKHVALGVSDEDRDGYGRLLRYVNVGRLDAGYRLLMNGLAIARYDSRDGYGYHPREPRYIAADRGARNLTCARPQPLVQRRPPANNCAPGYDPCVPPYPPDVDCADVNGPIYVTGSDPHGLDADGDGVACE